LNFLAKEIGLNRSLLEVIRCKTPGINGMTEIEF
jgi:hypothetical protein